MDELCYIVAKTSLLDVYKLLHGKLPMRDIILNQNEFWTVISGDEICEDVVTKENIDKIEASLLPEENACLKILTKQIQLFVQKFDSDFLATENFAKSDKKANLDEWSENVSFGTPLRSIRQFVEFELVDFKVEKAVFSEMPLYDEIMESIKEIAVMLPSKKQEEGTEEDKFRLTESFVNNLVIAA